MIKEMYLFLAGQKKTAMIFFSHEDRFIISNENCSTKNLHIGKNFPVP